MPHLFSFAAHTNDDALQEPESDEHPSKRLRRSSLFRKPLNLLRRYNGVANEPPPQPATAPTEPAQLPDYFSQRRPSLPDNVCSRKIVPSLPRPQTFRRQESERRERLLEVIPTASERRTLSVDRRPSHGPLRSLSPPRPTPFPSVSVPTVTSSQPTESAPPDDDVGPVESPSSFLRKDLLPLHIPDFDERGPPLIDDEREDYDDQIDKTTVQEDFERRWILNLSMHFRDKSNREKFFVTYAEKPNQWRRLTVSLDYRNAPNDSLEYDLNTLHFQRDKSFRIYEAIRESLPEIQYYDTVTNLKLETTRDDGQLHVHVREDANEIISYPAMSLFDHVRCPRFGESSLEFISHLSGFVYKVRLAGRVVIKKEIPGPDTVDEFLYEVNALDSLLGASNVVQLEGLVTDDRGELVKGLLISYASEGSLVDMIYDFRGSSQLPWHRREKWARQIVTGLSEIHEAGFVQGDFTLSNIVIDENDNAQIIDINRRGCPVGWEPPELSRLIDNGQRIGMCIGVKTDVFQLGMCLWALGEEVDEPERVERPLPDVYDAVPAYFRDIVRTCLSDKPQDRMGAKQLLGLFPESAVLPPTRAIIERAHAMHVSNHSESTATHRSAKEYIDPELAVTIDEVKERRRSNNEGSEFDTEQVTYVNADSNPASSTYRFESSGSWVVGRSRGRSPGSSRRRRSSPYGRTASSATSLSEDSPMRRFRIGLESASRSPCDDIAAGSLAGKSASRPSGHLDRRLTALQNDHHVPGLPHIDSGFDETMLDELGLDDSCLTDEGMERRPKTYVTDDEQDLTSPSQDTPTPGSMNTVDIDLKLVIDEKLQHRTFSSVSIETKRRASA